MVLKIGDGLRWDRDDHELSGFGGIDNGNGRRRDLGCHRGQALRSPGIRNRNLMSKCGEVTRKYRSHAPSADDSNSHVLSPFQNLIASCPPVRMRS
jgi:hypothetical protein